MPNRKVVIISSLSLGIVFFGIALYYWTTPAGNLPHYVPGFEAGSAHVHFKHGFAACLLSLGSFALAWFKSGPAKPTAPQVSA